MSRQPQKTVVHRPIIVECPNAQCKRPFRRQFTATEFQTWYEHGDSCECPRCGTTLSVEGLLLRCHVCEAELEHYGLETLWMHLDERCPNCAGHTDWNVPLYTVRIAESWSEQHDVYHWTRRGKASSCLRREGRTDYWEGLVHFCSPREFISIYRDRQISAASTGAYGRRAGSSGKTNAVCLTETTEENWDEIKALHGEYGFVFRKKDLIAIGGAPAIYLPDEVFEKMRLRREEVPETLWPYLNKLKIGKSAAGKPYDFLHEREWRVPQNIDFDQTPPYAVVFSPAPPNLPNEELILKAATEFQELSEFGMEDEEEPQSENEPRHEF